MPQASTVPVKGPDGKTYQFPTGTTKQDAVDYFAFKGIGGNGPAQGQPIPSPTGPTEMHAPTLAERVKRGLNVGKEALPYIGAGAAVAATPETGGLSDLLLPVFGAAMGGMAGESARQGTAAAIGSGDRPQSYTDAAKGMIGSGVNMAEQEMGSRVVGKGLTGFSTYLANKAARAPAANLTALTGEGSGQAFQHIIPDLQAFVKQSGRTPETPLEVQHALQSLGDTWDQDFNQRLALVGHQRVVPTSIARRIIMSITPDMPRTAEGRAEMKALNKAALEYQKPWSLWELNAKRSTNNKLLSAFYNKDSRGAATALTDADVRILKAVRDGAADIVYPAVDKATPDPFDARLLKQKQGEVWKLRDMLHQKVEDISNEQLASEGKTFRQKVSPSAVVSNRGAHGYLRGVSKLIPGGGAERQAGIQVKRAFAPQELAGWRHRVILQTPLSQLFRAERVASALSDKSPTGDDQDEQ